MMNYNHILIRYGELGLKGKNQKEFLRVLRRNIRQQIKMEVGETQASLEAVQGRLILHLNGEPAEKYYAPLNKVFGVSSYSPVYSCPVSEEAIYSTSIMAIDLLDVSQRNRPFRVQVRRADKKFPIASPELQIRIAKKVLEHFPDMNPDLKNYDWSIHCEVRFEAAYLYVETYPGLGGLPLGTGGRAMVLLSGGIDSPVAAWSMMRRGVVVEAIHFHSYPYTSKAAEEKVLQLAKEVAKYGGKMVVHLVPFTQIQESIAHYGHENLRITLMRRIMLRIAERIAETRHASALITGDNLGQVASQTIESLQTINAVTTMPILRPLIAYDKQDIMKIAENIGTYETSILPYEDCCTVFVPKEPKTKPRRDICMRDEEKMPLQTLIAKAIEDTTTITCFANGVQTEPESLLEGV